MGGKFTCVEVKTPEELQMEKEGKIVPRELKLERRRVLVPVNDAAKAMKDTCQEAIDLGLYKPEKGQTPDEMKEKLRKKETEYAKMGKGLPT